MEQYLQGLALALIEGLTEFIPVSSTGHMILLGEGIGFTGDRAHSYEVFIQLGAILAALVYYQERFLGLLPQGPGGWKNLLLGPTRPQGLHILLAILPVLLGGFLLHGVIKTRLFSADTVAWGLMIGGGLLDRLPLLFAAGSLEQVSLRQAGWIGLGQCLALWPGMSRSGSTMIASMLAGVERRPAADFSFIIAVPVMAAAVSYDLYKSWHFLTLNDAPLFCLGFVAAFVVAYGSIRWFLSVLHRWGLAPFGLYRIALGGLVLWLL